MNRQTYAAPRSEIGGESGTGAVRPNPTGPFAQDGATSQSETNQGARYRSTQGRPDTVSEGATGAELGTTGGFADETRRVPTDEPPTTAVPPAATGPGADVSRGVGGAGNAGETGDTGGTGGGDGGTNLFPGPGSGTGGSASSGTDVGGLGDTGTASPDGTMGGTGTFSGTGTPFGQPGTSDFGERGPFGAPQSSGVGSLPSGDDANQPNDNPREADADNPSR